MIQARYTFGMYPNILIAALNMTTLAGMFLHSSSTYLYPELIMLFGVN